MDFSRNKGFMVSKPQSNKIFFKEPNSQRIFWKPPPDNHCNCYLIPSCPTKEKGCRKSDIPHSKVYIMHAVTDMLSIVS